MIYSINKYPTLSHEFINTYVSDYDIFSYYLGSRFVIGKVFNSPLREDKTPSFGIIQASNGNLLYNDFTGDSGDVIKFVKELKGLKSYKEAMIEIYCDLILSGKRAIESLITVEHAPKKHTSSNIGVVRQPWSQNDFTYWGQFNITKKILIKFEVDPIKFLLFDDIVYKVYSDTDPMYVYKNYDKKKIYSPLADKKNKWFGSVTKNYIWGYKQLPESGELLIITKSLKDVMCLYSLGYIAISPPSETTMIPEHIMADLKKRFTKIIVFMDNDEAGILASKKLCEKYSLKSMSLKRLKDMSEHVQHYGVEYAKRWLEHETN